jgi:hypothetical protein
MNFSVIGIASRHDVDFIFEPTMWLEPIGEATPQRLGPRDQPMDDQDSTPDAARSHDQW